MPLATEPGYPTKSPRKGFELTSAFRRRWQMKSSTTHSTWSLIPVASSKLYIRSRTSPLSSQSCTHRITVNDVAYEGSHILERWALHFESLSKPHTPPDTDLTCLSHITHLLRTFPHTEPDLVDPEEVSSITSSLPCGKASGPDHLTSATST